MRSSDPFWLVATSAALGATAWSGPAWTIGLATIVPAFWGAATSRIGAGVVMLGYQLAATRGAPAGIAEYYGTWFVRGAVLWLAAATMIAGAWALLWSSAPARRPWGCLAALGLTAFPPIGIAGWVHPVTAAGALFPAAGWFGLAAHVGMMSALPAVPRRYLPPVIALVAAGAFFAASAPPHLSDWVALDTHHDFGTGAVASLRDYERQLELIAATRAADARVVLLPESAGGRWSCAAAAVWQPALPPNQLVLLGAEIPDRDGDTANALLAVDATAAATVYRQRMPVPVTMWHPWSAGGTRAYWFRNSVVSIAGRRAAVFICHEQVLVWPVLHSFLSRPDVVLACANLWWCADTTIPSIERHTMENWARLFAVPCLTATNS